MKGQPRREGPVRARALAQKGGAAQGPESATAWLDGCHEAIALHPEWQQVITYLYIDYTGATAVVPFFSMRYSCYCEMMMAVLT